MDRNITSRCSLVSAFTSLSARRAWIEIEAPSSAPYAALVALRKESVDRNFVPFDVIRPAIVALRKESVDRNSSVYLGYMKRKSGRSPQGERG